MTGSGQVFTQQSTLLQDIQEDPIARVRMISEQYAAWHASEANPISEGFEQAGYARFSRAEWTTPDGMLMMESLACTTPSEPSPTEFLPAG